MGKSDDIRRQVLAQVREYWKASSWGRPFVAGRDRIPYAGRVFDAEELVSLVDASLDFFLTAGRYAEEFERAFSSYLGVSDALLVNSGSSANLVAVAALMSPRLGPRGLKPGDEVITVAAAFPTTVAPIVQNHLIPVFVDINLGDYTAMPERVAEAIGPRTRAILLAHTLGVPFDLDAVMELAQRYDLWVIEDNCDSLGSMYRGKRTGTFGALSSHSFYPAHHMTMGEGGCVATADHALADIVRSMRDWGRDCHCTGGQSGACGRRFSQQFGDLPSGYDHKYVYSHIGYNLKITDMQAAVGCAQLKKLPGFIDRRKRNFVRLHEMLKPYEDRLILPRCLEHSEPAWFAFAMTVRRDAGFSRRDLVSFLEENLIETRNLFSGNLLRHPAYQGIPCRIVGDLSNSDTVTESSFFIGLYPGITDDHLACIDDVFRRFMSR